MSKNTAHDILNREMSTLPQVLEAARCQSEDKAVILARLVKGISLESWQKATHEFNLGNWYAFSVAPDSITAAEEMQTGEMLAISPFREVEGALTSGMFTRLLKRELLRLNRNGGSLSLLSAAIVDKSTLIEQVGNQVVFKLEGLLGASLLKSMDACDSLGILRKGQFICCMPGLGQLAARNLAEKAQITFKENACNFLEKSGLKDFSQPFCAVGIVNILQGESGTATELFKRSKASLELALSRQNSFIYQEISSSPFENTTLVHSSEKRFLFFGGDTQ